MSRFTHFRFALTLAALVALASPARLSAQEALPDDPALAGKIAQAISQLADDEWETREQATDTLIAIGRPCAETVFQAHERTESAEVRSRARRILLEIGEWRRLPDLVREKVDAALAEFKGAGVIWDPTKMAEPLCAGAGLEVVEEIVGEPTCAPLLVAGLSEEEPDVRGAVAWCLGRTKSPTAIDPLRSLLANRAEDASVRCVALWALGEIGDPSATVDVAEALGESDLRIQTAATIVSERLPSTDTVPRLIEALEHQDEAIRYNAFYTLTRLTGRRFGYNAFADPERRARPLAAWKAWWAENGATFTLPGK